MGAANSKTSYENQEDLGTEYGFSCTGFQYLSSLIESVDRKVINASSSGSNQKEEVQTMLMNLMQAHLNEYTPL